MSLRQALDLRRWFTDPTFSRFFKNTGVLMSGRVAVSALALGSVVLTARALGPEPFGTLALIKAYVMLVETLLTFQSWQALIKYGTEALERKRPDAFGQLVKFGTILDTSCAVLGAVLAASAVYGVGRWWGWDPDVVQLAAWYCLVMLFNLSGTPKAMLRLFNRFKLFAVQETLVAGVKLLGVIIAFASGAGLKTFLAVWVASEILGHVLLFVLGWRVLSQHGFGFRVTLGSPLRGLTRRCAGLWSFVWTTNINTTLKMGLKQLDLLIVGGVLGTAAAGLYKVAKQCAKIPADIIIPIQEALYPDVAKLWAQGEAGAIKRLMWRSGALAACGAAGVWLGFLFAGQPLLRLMFGSAFVGAQSILAWYLLGVTMAAATVSLTPVLLTLGRPQVIFWSNIASAAAYLPALVWLMQAFGLAGAGAAYVLYYLVWSLMMVSGAVSLLQQRHPTQAVRVGVAPVGPLST